MLDHGIINNDGKDWKPINLMKWKQIYQAYIKLGPINHNIVLTKFISY